MKSDYVKQLEWANENLQRKLEDAHLKIEEGNIREKCLQLRPKRVWSLNGYKDIKNVKEFIKYKREPYPDNAKYPDYMYWSMSIDKTTEHNEMFSEHFKYQMYLYMGITPKFNTSCAERWLDDKIMEMPILLFSWYRFLNAGRIFRGSNKTVGVDGIHHSSVCRRYIIEKGNPEVYYFMDNGRFPAFTNPIRIKP